MLFFHNPPNTRQKKANINIENVQTNTAMSLYNIYQFNHGDQCTTLLHQLIILNAFVHFTLSWPLCLSAKGILLFFKLSFTSVSCDTFLKILQKSVYSDFLRLSSLLTHSCDQKQSRNCFLMYFIQISLPWKPSPAHQNPSKHWECAPSQHTPSRTLFYPEFDLQPTVLKTLYIFTMNLV